MKTLLAATAIALGLSAPAYAQSPPCGGGYVDPVFNSSFVLPNGQTAFHVMPITGYWGDNGLGQRAAYAQGQHRACGQIQVDVYTGDGPMNALWLVVQLDPLIVKPTTVAVKCTVTLGQAADAYYYGYNDPLTFPDGDRADVMQPTYYPPPPQSPTNVFANIYIHGGGNLQSRSVYAVFLNCPPNL